MYNIGTESNSNTVSMNSNSSQNPIDYSTNYYTAYTNKLYEGGSEKDYESSENIGSQSYNYQSPNTVISNDYGGFKADYGNNKYGKELEGSNTKSDYQSINMDDGMSSLAFLNELKTMKFTTTNEQVDLGSGNYYNHTTTIGTYFIQL